jgi:hypothetical protein
MKVKFPLIIFFALCLIFSISGILNIFPASVVIPGIEKSGYFQNIDEKYDVIIDSFLGIKILARPEYAWIFIDDLEKKHDLEIEIFNSRGERVFTPGFKDDIANSRVSAVINSGLKEGETSLEQGVYERIIPVKAEKKCIFCHKNQNTGDIIGAIKFKGKYNSIVYHTKERSLIFSMISLVLVIILLQLARWNPYERVKELFDK